jgi:hypothetical protein
MKPLVIGITGLAHSGKDTSADYLYSKLRTECNVVKIALADQLKVICQSLIQMFYGQQIPLDEFYDMGKKEAIRDELPKFAGQPFKLRTILQMVGTEIFRDLISKSVWCNYIKEKYIDNNACDILIISDIRMPDEISFFTDLVKNGQLDGFKCYRIIRSNRSVLSANNQAHQTERLISTLQVDRDIVNESSIDDLYKTIDDIIIQDISVFKPDVLSDK